MIIIICLYSTTSGHFIGIMPCKSMKHQIVRPGFWQLDHNLATRLPSTASSIVLLVRICIISSVTFGSK